MQNFTQFFHENKTTIICLVVLLLLIILGLVAKMFDKNIHSVDKIKLNKNKIKVANKLRNKLAKQIVSLHKEIENVKNSFLDELKKTDSQEVLNIVLSTKKQLKYNQDNSHSNIVQDQLNQDNNQVDQDQDELNQDNNQVDQDQDESNQDNNQVDQDQDELNQDDTNDNWEEE